MPDAAPQGDSLYIYPIVGLRLQKCCLKILFKKSSLMIMDHHKTVCILIIILSILSHCSLQPKINTHFKHNFVTCNIFRVPCKRGSMCPGRWIFLKVQRHHKVKRHFVRLFTSSHQPDKTIVKVFKKFSGVYDRNFGGTWSGI